MRLRRIWIPFRHGKRCPNSDGRQSAAGGRCSIHVLHCGPSPVAVNKQRSGIYEGISFQYTTWLKRPKNKFIRLLTYAWALVGLTIYLARLWPVRRSTLVYLYVMDGSLNLYSGILCQLLGLSVMQEFCEWFPSRPNFSRFNRWLYRKRIFKAATGALVISRAIEERVTERCEQLHCKVILHRVGVMVDSQRFASGLAHASDDLIPKFVWCGSWLNDDSS